MSGRATASAAKSGGGGYRRSSVRIVSIVCPRPWSASAPAGRSPAPPPPAVPAGPPLSGPVSLILSPPAGNRQYRPRNAGSRSQLQVVRVVGQLLGTVGGDEDQILEADPAVPVPVEAGLERDHVSFDQRLALDAADARTLVH